MSYENSIYNIKTDKNINKVHLIDEQMYYFDIWIYNQIDGQDPFEIPFLFIDAISIEESLYDWNTKGWIVLNNQYEILEKKLPNKSNSPFIFRGDGRNRLRLTITPIFNKNSSENDEELRKKWEISLDCVIYDVEDIDTGSISNKRRKFYFHDERYQIFSEKNIEWSTAIEGRNKQFGFENTTNNASNPDSPDSERCCRANIALKSIIDTAGKNPDGTQIKIGGGTIDNPEFSVESAKGNTTQPNSHKWTDGTDDNNIFYTSPAYSTVIDDIKYITNYCGSLQEGPCFLDVVRWNDPLGKPFELIPLRDYFTNAEKEQVEHLVLRDGISEFDNNTSQKGKIYIPKAPNEISNPVQNFMSGKASFITSYYFSPMVSSDDSRLCTTPSHNFDFSKGTFNINFKDNTIDDLEKNMTDYAKTGLFSFNSHGNPHVLMNINRTKKDAIMLKNHFEPLQFFPKFLPQINMIRDLLFLNESICFTTRGLTIRAPGRFLFIDKVTSNGDPDPHDDRFLGQWLVTKVNHLFQKQNYSTQVVATKIDAFNKIWNVKDSKY